VSEVEREAAEFAEKIRAAVAWWEQRLHLSAAQVRVAVQSGEAYQDAADVPFVVEGHPECPSPRT
jgi:predicted component of type VI protein secretion system